MNRRSALAALASLTAGFNLASCGGGENNESPPMSGNQQAAPEAEEPSQTLSVKNALTGEQILPDSQVLGMTKIKVEGLVPFEEYLSIHDGTIQTSLLPDMQEEQVEGYWDEFWLPVVLQATRLELRTVKPLAYRSDGSSPPLVFAPKTFTLTIVPHEAGSWAGQVSESYYRASIFHKEQAVALLDLTGADIHVKEAIKATNVVAQDELARIQNTMMYGRTEIARDHETREVQAMTQVDLQQLDQFLLAKAHFLRAGGKPLHAPDPNAPNPPPPRTAEAFLALLDPSASPGVEKAASCSSTLPISSHNQAYVDRIVSACQA